MKPAVLKQTRVKKSELGYSIQTRAGKRGVAALLRKFGDTVFDAGAHSGGSGRPA